MPKAISPDTEAVLLLCGRFGERRGDVDPLSPGEYGRLVSWLRERELRPSDLLERGASGELTAAKLDPARIDALLKRGAALALATEKWLRTGLWITSRGDETYPRRLKKKLGPDAPALLYGAGDPGLLDLGGLAIVGSRNATEEVLEYTRRVARRCAVEGVAVVSGGARGVDAAAMQGASEAGGKVIGVLADSLLRASVNRENRVGIEERRLVLVSPFNPVAGFHAGNAMQRNAYIYTLADAALVVQADLRKGGTWNGAVENLRKGWVPLFVREDATLPGNGALLSDGGRAFLPDGSISDLLAAESPSVPAPAELFSSPVASELPATYEASQAAAFLEEIPKRRIAFDKPVPFTPVGLYLGNGALGLEVVVVESARKSTAGDLRTAWRLRHGGRAVPVLVVALGPNGAAICGPSGEEPPVAEDVDRGQAERLCREALALPDRHAALRFLTQALPSLETKLPGIRNEGLLASHELAVGVRQRHDWRAAIEKASAALGRTGEPFLRALGFEVERCDGVTSFLKSRDRKAALAVLLQQSEAPEAGTARFSGLSPVTYALSIADKENLPYVVVVQDARIRLYPTDVGKGVGRRARSETYVECHASLLRDEDAAYLWLLFSAEALAKGGTFEQILEESGRFAGNPADRLRDRIYERVVPQLARAVAEARRVRKPTAEDLARAKLKARDRFITRIMREPRILIAGEGDELAEPARDRAA
ncbi:MAG: DNA-protecting protein DprA [Burkholderiales bacterium]|nr:DNA-protecting protein DprA [Burkholderiales bacterium]